MHMWACKQWHCLFFFLSIVILVLDTVHWCVLIRQLQLFSLLWATGFLSLFINPQSGLHRQHGVITCRYGHLHFLPWQQCGREENGLILCVHTCVYKRVCVYECQRQAAGIIRNISNTFLPFSNKWTKFSIPHNSIVQFSGKCVSPFSQQPLVCFSPLWKRKRHWIF